MGFAQRPPRRAARRARGRGCRRTRRGARRVPRLDGYGRELDRLARTPDGRPDACDLHRRLGELTPLGHASAERLAQLQRTLKASGRFGSEPPALLCLPLREPRQVRGLWSRSAWRWLCAPCSGGVSVRRREQAQALRHASSGWNTGGASLRPPQVEGAQREASYLRANDSCPALPVGADSPR